MHGAQLRQTLEEVKVTCCPPIAGKLYLLFRDIKILMFHHVQSNRYGSRQPYSFSALTFDNKLSVLPPEF